MDNNLPKERKSSGSMPYVLSNYNVQGFSTSREPVVEIWSMLEYYLIDKAADELFKTKGIQNKVIRKKVARDFQSYITQARNFYEYAKNSDPRSSALLYYYSFMNLGKAKLLVSNPSLHDKKFVHGLKRVVETGDLVRLSMRAENANSANRISIYKELYHERFKTEIMSNHYFKLIDLLGYVSDVTLEYERVTKNNSRTVNVKYLSINDNDRMKTWAKIAISSPDRILKFKKESKRFSKEFTQIQVSSLSRQFNFELSPFAAQHYKFYEGKTEFDFIGNDGIDIFSLNRLMKQIFHPFFQTEAFSPENSFQLVSPLKVHDLETNRVKSNIRIDELMAIYAVMYHLSELVRYEPYIIDKLLSQDTKEGWLLRSFIESAPYTFLLRMTSWINETDYRVDRR